MFRTDKRGFLPELMDKLYQERVIYKKKMIEAKRLYQETGDKRLQNDIFGPIIIFNLQERLL